MREMEAFSSPRRCPGFLFAVRCIDNRPTFWKRQTESIERYTRNYADQNSIPLGKIGLG